MLKLSQVTVGKFNNELLNTVRRNNYESAISFMKIYKHYYPSQISKAKNKLFKLRSFLRNHLPIYLYFDPWRNVRATQLHF